MSKSRRHYLLKDLLSSPVAQTQEVLVGELKKHGIEVTQATISRDLSELGALRTSSGYVLPSELSAAESQGTREELCAILRSHALRTTQAASIAIIHTAPGHANFVASAIDASRFPEILGTIAGDDTIFLATGSNTMAKALCEQLVEIMEGKS